MVEKNSESDDAGRTSGSGRKRFSLFTAELADWQVEELTRLLDEYRALRGTAGLGAEAGIEPIKMATHMFDSGVEFLDDFLGHATGKLKKAMRKVRKPPSGAAGDQPELPDSGKKNRKKPEHKLRIASKHR